MILFLFQVNELKGLFLSSTRGYDYPEKVVMFISTDEYGWSAQESRYSQHKGSWLVCTRSYDKSPPWVLITLHNGLLLASFKGLWPATRKVYG